MLYRKCPAIGQFDEGTPWFSSALQQMLSRYPKSTLHSGPGLNSIFFSPKHSLPHPTPQLYQNFVMTLPSKHKNSPNFQLLSSAAYSQQPTSLHDSVLNSQTRYLVSRRTSGHCLRTFRAVHFTDPPAILNIVPLFANSTLHSLSLSGKYPYLFSHPNICN